MKDTPLPQVWHCFQLVRAVNAKRRAGEHIHPYESRALEGVRDMCLETGFPMKEAAEAFQKDFPPILPK